VLRAKVAQSFEIIGARRDDAHVAGDGFDDEAGDLPGNFSKAA